MIFAKVKDQKEQERLDKAIDEAKDKKWYRRLMIIKLSSQGKLTRHLKKEFGIGEATIRRYINSYNRGSLEELKPKKSKGRRPKIAHWTKADWDRVFEQTPNQYEKLNTHSRNWTYELIVDYLREYHQIDVSIASVYNSLRKTNRRTGRSKLRVGSPDPDYQVKRQNLETFKGLPERDN